MIIKWNSPVPHCNSGDKSQDEIGKTGPNDGMYTRAVTRLSKYLRESFDENVDEIKMTE